MERKQEHATILRVLGGDREAYALLVEEYKSAIFNLAYRMTGSYEDASDLAQETFTRAYINLKKFQTDRRFFTWLYTIGLNVIRNHLKKERLSGIMFFRGKETERVSRSDGQASDSMQKSGHVFQEPVISGGNPEDGLLASEETRKLASCLKHLPSDQREALILRFYEGLSFEEIAEITGRSQSAVKMRVYRGLERLKRLM